jgi:hypothetical protein
MCAKRILATAGILAMVTGGLTAGLASSAQASTRPVLYTINGWSHPEVRPIAPQDIRIGQGGAPWVIPSGWDSWTSKEAKSGPGNAAVVIDSHTYQVRVTLSAVRHHDGRAYYSKMVWYSPGHKVFFINGHYYTSLTLHFIILPGATMPFWN